MTSENLFRCGFYIWVSQELFDRCENKRRTLFKLASETEDNDNSLGECERMSQNFSCVRVVTAHTVRDLFYCRGHPAGQ